MSHILYVEDDPFSRSVMQMVQQITPEPMILTVFEDSVNFEQRLLGLDPQPEVILLDIHVQPYSGFDMLQIIRTHSQLDAIPVVALTASVMNEEIQLLKESGFQGVIANHNVSLNVSSGEILGLLGDNSSIPANQDGQDLSGFLLTNANAGHQGLFWHCKQYRDRPGSASANRWRRLRWSPLGPKECGNRRKPG